ncbi:Guanine nucleotide exchange factor for Rab-3A Rab-3A-interacting-like protein 1 [Larimichthys crocea]|uniref:Guanine nucleotide exchange factor for Rab-3A Rab-3A-interacting-like protein 1 n=1 Tax=Larimichthys crocea TaxID=215358 RepID=A0A6G0IYA2_LARCR|nr:guanine nucleotide exchange factor for Rab-3A isoform X1 [Larimichthys crocea]XP_027128767.1 guanine nucleotide exchange factor for Rab-3A isoform X1 [Larimichthys crocea]KAE8296216.1 Guanine nucleotide exchange factor for Rab-3A Rab-3A-interacting-like protein 1 [Larimichthys crocea]
MDAFEGIHSVRISSSPPSSTTASPGYEILKAGRSGIAVYSSTCFYGTPDVRGARHKSSRETEEEGCVVGRLVDLDPESESRVEGGGGQAVPTSGRDHGDLSRLRSSSLEIREKEIREKGSEILREQLDAAKKELKLKDKECERLSQVRNQLEQELEELTASLFEEAHKMVHEANVKQAGAEKQLKEAQGKIDVLQAEVTALKTLVLTSTPSSPNRQLHPQLQSSGTRGAYKHVGGHIRNKSASGAFPSSHGKPEPSSVPIQPVAKEDREMDSVLYAEFLMWKENPSLERSSAFLSRIYREDIGPCLSFTRSELSQLVQSAVENNSLTIEPVAMSALPMVKASAIECGGPNGFRAAIETKCALSGMSRLCRHRIKLGDKGSYYYISPSSRARITAVCNFFTYIRYIQQGLVRHEAEQMFWEVMRLRREMTVAKLGFYLADQG